MDVSRYLERFGAHDQGDPPSLDHLAELQRRHLRSVPFENLDVVAGRPIGLDPAAHYAKVVERRRGGFCYELNVLFGWLLDALGYEVRVVEARARPGDRFQRRFSHLALLVDFGASGPPSTREGWFLVDVSYGDFARQPLPLDGEPRSDVSGTYRVVARGDGRFESQYRGPRPGETADGAPAPDAWVPRYRLSTAPRDLAAFEPACAWTQRSPDSAFTGRLLCSMATDEGRMTLSTRALTVTVGDEKTRTSVAPDERLAVLRERFGIELDEPPVLPDERPA